MTDTLELFKKNFLYRLYSTENPAYPNAGTSWRNTFDQIEGIKKSIDLYYVK